MNILVLISFIILTSYLVIMGKRYGILTSISANYYISKYPILFTFVMIITSFCMMIPMIEVAPSLYLWSGFLTGGGLTFVGVAAAYKKELTKLVHILGAVISGLSAFIWSYLLCNIIAGIVVLLFLAIILFSKSKNTFYWIEVLLLLMTYSTYLIVIL